ncbi:MAG TPA: ATP--guanido phosphotransferase, partial [bacterium (Candidatus Stahlbacteria)]|nr:ATP--guanido phosphotransferase [Candidatus Stahlbacteria bacterium]
MKFEDLINNPPLWINGKGNFGEIVLSSRVRIARNLTPFPFPERASDAELEEILNITKGALQSTPSLKDGLFLKIGELSAIDKEFLRERYLITKNLEERPQHRGIMIGQGEYLSVMINEEDHLRIQALAPGLNLEQAWTTAEKLERELESRLDFAFSKEFGYLTACLTNVGTG